MLKLLYILLAVSLPATAAAQNFSDFLARVDAAPEQRRPFLVDSFLTIVPGYPFIENDTTVHFLYTGSAEEVRLVGDHNNWDDSNAPLKRLSTTNLWYRSDVFESDARIDYKLVVNKSWILDPRNPLTIASGYGPNSELRMPAYQPPTEIQPQQSVPHGRTVETQFSSAALMNVRDAYIYLPAGYDQSAISYPVVLFHDGPDYVSLAHTTTILDNIISEKRIPPCIAVFLPAVNRNAEYAGNLKDLFARFVVEEVMAWVDSTYRTRRDAAARAVFGSSNGGNIALYIGAHYPQSFGNVAAQSSNIIEDVRDEFSSAPALPLRLYLDLGTYDIPVLIPLVRNFIPMVISRGYEVMYREYNEGHSWGNWRAHIDDALEYFFSHLVSVSDIPPMATESLEIQSISPHPLHHSGTVTVRLARAGQLRMQIRDIAGNLIREVWSGHREAGLHAFPVEGSGLVPGSYILTLSSAHSRRSRLILIR